MHDRFKCDYNLMIMNFDSFNSADKYVTKAWCHKEEYMVP